MTGTARHPAVILAGGRSSRMGEAKALLAFGGHRLIDHVAARLRPQVGRILLNANDPAITLAGASAKPDRMAGHKGPLAGIQAGLADARETDPDATHVVMLPVDCPFFPRDIVAQLSASLDGSDDIALAGSGGRLHPVLGLWPVSVEPDLAEWLRAPPTLKVRAFLEGRSVKVTDYPLIETRLGPLDPFFNINTRSDLDVARRLLNEVDP
jgi:molybdopterin-guanine dinucleotide biosynthesis protein A